MSALDGRREVDTSVLYLAATLRTMVKRRDPRRWTAGAIVACRAVAVSLWILALPVGMAGWDRASGWLAALALAAYAAEGIVERLDDRLLDAELADGDEDEPS